VAVYNIPGVAAGQLVLTLRRLPISISRHVARWNDPAIKKLNPSLNLPDQAIAVVHRSDGSRHDVRLCDVPFAARWTRAVVTLAQHGWPVQPGMTVLASAFLH